MELTTDAYMTIPEIHGVFVDSILTNEADNLVFGSFWSRDTAMRDGVMHFRVWHQRGVP